MVHGYTTAFTVSAILLLLAAVASGTLIRATRHDVPSDQETDAEQATDADQATDAELVAVPVGAAEGWALAEKGPPAAALGERQDPGPAITISRATSRIETRALRGDGAPVRSLTTGTDRQEGEWLH